MCRDTSEVITLCWRAFASLTTVHTSRYPFGCLSFTLGMRSGDFYPSCEAPNALYLAFLGEKSPGNSSLTSPYLPDHSHSWLRNLLRLMSSEVLFKQTIHQDQNLEKNCDRVSCFANSCCATESCVFCNGLAKKAEGILVLVCGLITRRSKQP